MRVARVRVHGALGDFLAPERREVEFEAAFELPVGLRDLIQSSGVPHVEVGRVLVGGDPAGWERVVGDGERVEAFPRYPLAEPPGVPRFLLDVHLGRLARYLRLGGIDAEHDPEADDPALVAASVGERRILLTRDRGLLMHARLRDGSFVRATDPIAQAAEVVGRFALRGLPAPFTRCMVCNHLLAAASREEAAGRVPDGVLAARREYRRCPGCGRIYWRGSHQARLEALVLRMQGPGPA
jgi:uncharacterized protein with PIN domain